MTSDRTTDPIDNEISDFIEFFTKSMGELQFPDVDRASLEALAQGVRDRSAELGKLNQQVQAARQALDHAQAELRRVALRGLAYARVYAEGDPELSQAVAGLSLGREARETRKPRRKSPAQNKHKKPGTNRRNAAQGGKDSPVGELPFASEQPTPAEAA